MDEYGISKRDMTMVYMSPDPYYPTTSVTIDLQKFDAVRHPMAGLRLLTKENRVIVGHISRGSPVYKSVRRPVTTLRSAWLQQIDDRGVSSVEEVQGIFHRLSLTGAKECRLTFSHPEIEHDLANGAISQINLDQLNNRRLLRPPRDDDAIVKLLSEIPSEEKRLPEYIGFS